jgi:hypothetical protein
MMRWMLLRCLPAVAGLGLSLTLSGCMNTKPDRTMRQPKVEEFSVPPPSYDKVADLPRTEPLLTPKSGGPGLNTNSPNLPGGPQTNGSLPGGRQR